MSVSLRLYGVSTGETLVGLRPMPPNASGSVCSTVRASRYPSTWVCVHGASLAGRKARLLFPEVAVKLSIKAELAYSFADATQIIANIEASDTSDQSILSETLEVQPSAKILSDKSVSGARRKQRSPVASKIRAAASVVRSSERSAALSVVQPILSIR
jgi:hypothetical protein